MLRLFSEITVNNVTFSGIISAEIETTWQNITDTCRLELPNNFQRNGKPITVGDEGFFKRGDEIVVKLGYFPNLIIEFEGFIRRIFVDNVIVIEAEDASFLLKQSTVTESFKKVSLKELLDAISPIKFEAVEANLGQFRITRATPAKVLEELKKTYGLISYIRSGVLRVGLAYYEDEGKEQTFDLEENVVTNDIEYIDNSELLITVHGISAQSDNTKIERFAFYDKSEIKLTDQDPKQGEKEIFGVPGLTEEELDFYIKNKLEKRLTTGARGTFLAFLEPSVQHGDQAKIISRKFPEKAGTFLIKKVVKTFGFSGARQEITLDTQIV